MKVFIGAGESSSDKIAGKIINKIPNGCDLYGITGVEMKSCGVKTTFNTSDISFIGFDILMNLFSVINIINKTVDWIMENEPEIAIFVDAYDFYIRVAKKLKKRGCKTKIIAVVAPLAWLYSSGKTKQINKYFDKLICIFPFEPNFFAQCGHKDVHFFGNPFLQQIENKILPRDKNLVLITIGSRPNEIKRHMPLILNVIKIINKTATNIIFFMPTTKETHNEIMLYFCDFKNIEYSFDEKIKDIKMRTAYFAIAKSGTNTSEIAARGLTALIYYKIGFLSYFVGKFILKIKMINMINIVAKKQIIPEIIQIFNNPNQIVNCFFEFYKNEKKCIEQNISVLDEIKKMQGDFNKNFEESAVNNIFYSSNSEPSCLS